MVEIFGQLFSDKLFEEHFTCNLQKCKGICCVDGDVGAPITDKEANIISEIIDKVKPLLTTEGIEEISENGLFDVDDEFEKVTPTINNGLCVYGYYDEHKIVKCAFEEMYNRGEIDFPKPISCALFPIRIVKTKLGEIANYAPRMDLCMDACKLGAELKMPVYQFLKNPITRHYGSEMYEAMENVYQEYFKKST